MSNEAGSVNSQVLDSTTGLVTLLTGHAPSQSFGLLDVVMAETLGMVMYNAVNRQQGAGAIGSAAVTAACARMLGAQPMVVPPPPEPPDVPGVKPLIGPVPNPPPDVAVATAYAEAEIAVQALRQQAAGATSTSQTAQADLDSLIIQAGGKPPTPPSPSDTKVRQAVAQARAAIDVLKKRADDPIMGRAELDTLIIEAGGVPPPTQHFVQAHATKTDPDIAEAFAAASRVIRELKALVEAGAVGPWRAASIGLEDIIIYAGGTLPLSTAPHEH